MPLAGGQTVVADETYIRESILRPAKKQVAGYQQIMPTYEGQISEEGVMHLIAYIKTLGAPPRRSAAGTAGCGAGAPNRPPPPPSRPPLSLPLPPAEDNAANESEGNTP